MDLTQKLDFNQILFAWILKNLFKVIKFLSSNMKLWLKWLKTHTVKFQKNDLFKIYTVWINDTFKNKQNNFYPLYNKFKLFSSLTELWINK